MKLLRFLILFAVSVQAAADSRFVVRSTTKDKSGQTATQRDVQYRKGSLRRKESWGAQKSALYASIANCGDRQAFLVDLAANQYRRFKLPVILSTKEYDNLVRTNGQDAVKIQSETRDTGESKVFFGRSARHLITTLRRVDKTPGEETIDGWYIDHDLPDQYCAPPDRDSNLWLLLPTAIVNFPEIAAYEHKGPLPTGLAVQETITVRTASANLSIERIIEELSDDPLLDKLFSLPQNSKENPNLLRGTPQ